MKYRRLMPVLVVTSLLAACSTASDETGGAAQSGVMTPSQATDVEAGQAMTGPSPGSTEEFTTVVGDRVFFRLDQSGLSPAAQATLRKQAVWLLRYANRSIVVEGHADERGTREYNLALGERRAASVRDYLVAQGIAAQRIRVISYGKERPVCAQSTEQCWTQNRRAVTLLK